LAVELVKNGHALMLYAQEAALIGLAQAVCLRFLIEGDAPSVNVYDGVGKRLAGSAVNGNVEVGAIVEHRHIEGLYAEEVYFELVFDDARHEIMAGGQGSLQAAVGGKGVAEGMKISGISLPDFGTAHGFGLRIADLKNVSRGTALAAVKEGLCCRRRAADDA